jgi:hypothetical protein
VGFRDTCPTPRCFKIALVMLAERLWGTRNATAIFLVLTLLLSSAIAVGQERASQSAKEPLSSVGDHPHDAVTS